LNDATIIWAFTISAAVAVVVYVIWSRRHDNEQWERRQDQRDLLLQIQHELDRQQAVLLSRCTDLQRKLDHHYRILKYLRHRLS
jgi:hypothetical protein